MTLVPRGNFFDVDRVFDHLWSPGLKAETAESGFFAPRVDIKELDDHYEITAELPGVSKEDVHIALEDGVLSITAEINQEDSEEKEGRIIRQERRYGKYMRSFSLDKNVSDADISANFVDGVLKLSAAKAKEEVPQKRRIEIS
jgi:HSP20 family protein